MGLQLLPGPCLADTPLFQAALLPLQFAAGERREDLVSLLLSPYYGEFQPHRASLALWDRSFREHRVDQGWDRLQRVAAARDLDRESAAILDRLDRLRGALAVPAATGGSGPPGCTGLAALGFPRLWRKANRGSGVSSPACSRAGPALGSDPLSAAEFLEWLSHGARQLLLPGPGVQEAGIQVLGLLEMRGLAFSRVFCLGLNSGAFPPPPRPLPLLTAGEKFVLGGTYQSQHRFARELFHTFWGPHPRSS